MQGNLKEYEEKLISFTCHKILKHNETSIEECFDNLYAQEFEDPDFNVRGNSQQDKL